MLERRFFFPLEIWFPVQGDIPVFFLGVPGMWCFLDLKVGVVFLILLLRVDMYDDRIIRYQLRKQDDGPPLH